MMIITDEITGLVVRVDQSLDSSLKASPEDMKHLIQEFIQIHIYLKQPYSGQFDGHNIVKINNIKISFSKTEGIRAYRWIKKYISTVLNVMSNDNIIDLPAIEKAAEESAKNEKKDGV